MISAVTLALFYGLLSAVRYILSCRRVRQISRIKGPRSPSFLTGHIRELYHRSNGLELHRHLSQDYDGVARVKGFLGDDQLYISDPLALHAILVKEQDAYEETRVFIEIIFGEGLVSTIGELHRKQRKLVTPAFSLYRLKRLVPTFQAVALRLKGALFAEMRRSGGIKDRTKDMPWKTDLSEWLTRAALESIGLAGLGYSLDPLDSPSMNPYTKAVRALIPTMFRIAPLRLLTPYVTRLGPPGFRRFLLRLVPIRAVQQLREMADQMERTCREVLRRKRHPLNATNLGSGSKLAGAAGDTNTESGLGHEVEGTANGDGRDIMSILLRANEHAVEREKLNESELLGQMNVLIFGAQDTTASALSRVIYLLSRSESRILQERLRDEFSPLKGAIEEGRLKYEDLETLPILDAVLKETLRLYPPVPFVRRVATRDTILPLTHTIQLTDGTYVDQIEVPKHTTIWLSISGANRSPDVWGPDADEWRPERWLEHVCDEDGEHLKSKDNAWLGKLRVPGIYSGMLTFLAGGRSCIGYRFALIEMKIILATLISTFRFSSTEDRISWNLSQIVSPSFISYDNGREEDVQGMPIIIEAL